MKKLVFFLLFLFTITPQLVLSQCAKIDSLRRVAPFIRDVEQKVNTLNLLAKELVPEKNGSGLYYAQQALRVARKYDYQSGLADALVIMGVVKYTEELSQEEAIEHLKEALEIYQTEEMLEETASTYETLGQVYYDLFYLKRENYGKALDNYLSALEIRKELDDKSKMADVYDQLGEIYSQMGENKKSVEFFAKAFEVRENDPQKSRNDKRLLARAQQIYDLEMNEHRLKLYVAVLGIALFAALALIMGILFLKNRKSYRRLKDQNARLSADGLLLSEEHEMAILEQRMKDAYNLLPDAVYQEIKENGSYPPRQHDMVTILFSDLEDFTSISKGMGKEEVIKELNVCFTEFDQIIEKYNLTKLKTLGDSYMCAGGVPIENKTNAVEAILAALDMKRFIDQRRAEKMASHEPYWKLRMGIHTGYVTAGVVGAKKFAYDVWGETVNTAKLLEIQGNSGKITISEDTYEYVKDFFDIDEGGVVKIKHKGHAKQYYVTNIKVHLSENGEGLVPNEAFMSRLNYLEVVE